MSDVAISVDGVSKRFLLQEDRATSLKELFTTRRRRNPNRGFEAIRDVTLDVPAGSTFGLIGHNGSGKSTLLRLMAGIHQPTTGTITTRGRISALLELGSGFHPDLTGRENIYLNGAMLGIAKKEMRRNVDEIVEFAGLQEFIDQPVKVYSSGMYVRLGFAVSVHVEPEILLVDEVMAVGDEEFQRRCLEHMYRLRREGVTIVFVSHSLGLVETMCETVAWLDHGQLMQVGNAPEVCAAYLSMVNADEASRRSADIVERDATRTVELTAEHQGTGELRLYHADLLDEEWYPVPHATSGEAITLRLWYDAAVAVTDPIITFDLFHENGTHVGGASTRGRLSTGDIAVGQGYLDFSIPDLGVNPGNYFLSTQVTDSEGLHVFDEVGRIIPLRVVASATDLRGMVRLRGEFGAVTSHDVGLHAESDATEDAASDTATESADG